MAEFFAVQALDSFPAVDQAQAGEMGVAYGNFALGATPLLANADEIHMCWLPALHRIVDCIVQMDDLDGVANFSWDAGITDDPVGATEDDDALIVAETTVGQAAGMVRMADQAGLLIATVNNRRRVGITVNVLPATQTAGDIRMWLMYRAEDSRDSG